MRIDNTARAYEEDYEDSEKDSSNMNNIGNIATANIIAAITSNINTEKSYKHFIGIDVAKYKLDLYDTITNSHKTIKNTEEDLLNYIKDINKHIDNNNIDTNEILIIIDLTGGYEKLTLNTFYKIITLKI